MRQRACRLAVLSVLCWLVIVVPQLQSAGADVETITLRVQAIRLTDDDGGRPADTSPTQFSEWVEFANASFAPAGIAFAYDPVADFAVGARHEPTGDEFHQGLPRRDAPAVRRRRGRR